MYYVTYCMYNEAKLVACKCWCPRVEITTADKVGLTTLDEAPSFRILNLRVDNCWVAAHHRANGRRRAALLENKSWQAATRRVRRLTQQLVPDSLLLERDLTWPRSELRLAIFMPCDQDKIPRPVCPRSEHTAAERWEVDEPEVFQPDSVGLHHRPMAHATGEVPHTVYGSIMFAHRVVILDSHPSSLLEALNTYYVYLL